MPKIHSTDIDCAENLVIADAVSCISADECRTDLPQTHPFYGLRVARNVISGQQDLILGDDDRVYSITPEKLDLLVDAQVVTVAAPVVDPVEDIGGLDVRRDL